MAGVANLTVDRVGERELVHEAAEAARRVIPCVEVGEESPIVLGDERLEPVPCGRVRGMGHTVDQRDVVAVDPVASVSRCVADSR